MTLQKIWERLKPGNKEAQQLRAKIVGDIQRSTRDVAKINKELKKTTAYKIGRVTYYAD